MSPRRWLAVVVLAAIPTVAACGAGQSSETSLERTSPYVGNGAVGPMLIRGAMLVPATTSATPTATASATGVSTESPSPSPSPSARRSASPSPSPTAAASPQAYLILTLVNHGTSPDTLTGVSLGSGMVQPGGASPGSLTVQPGRTMSFGDPEIDDTGSLLIVTELSTPPVVGTSATVTFTFQNAGSGQVAVPVRDPSTVGTTATATPIPYSGTYPALPTEVPQSASPAPSESTTP